MKINHIFRVFGDNILECEIFINWLQKTNFSKFQYVKEEGVVDRPIFIFKDMTNDEIFVFQLCPFYGNVDDPIWSDLQISGFVNEKPDVLIIKVNDDGSNGEPILIIEYDDAIQAGNQAWQRARRSVDAAKNKIPYCYVLPIIGWERSADGLSLKNPRYLSAGSVLGQLSLNSFYNCPSVQIYKQSPWEKEAIEGKYTLPENSSLFNDIDNGIEFVSYLIRRSVDNKSVSKPYDTLEKIFSEMINVAKTYSNFSNTQFPIHINHESFKDSNPSVLAKILSKKIIDQDLIESKLFLDNIEKQDFFQHGALFHKDAQVKTTSTRFQDLIKKINWAPNEKAENKIRWLNEWDVKINGGNPDDIIYKNLEKIPITYKSTKSEAALINNRKSLRQMIESTYPNLSANILNWIYDGSKKEPVFFIPLYGYKPTGDSRPDRGIIPLLFSLFPRLLTKKNTMVIMYSKHTPTNWEEILEKDSNQLWTAIKEYCGMIIVDKTQTGVLL